MLGHDAQVTNFLNDTWKYMEEIHRRGNAQLLYTSLRILDGFFFTYYRTHWGTHIYVLRPAVESMVQDCEQPARAAIVPKVSPWEDNTEPVFSAPKLQILGNIFAERQRIFVNQKRPLSTPVFGLIQVAAGTSLINNPDPHATIRNY